MKLHEAFPNQQPKQPIDFNDLSELSRQLLETSEELAGMAEGVAKAKTIREFSSDQRKRALAISTREHIDHESAAAADIKGRASPLYGEQLEQLKEDLNEAEQCLAKYETIRIRWESLRSAISTWRQVVGNT